MSSATTRHDVRTNLPTGWTVETERTTYDELVGRDDTTVLSRQAQTRRAVYIHEVVAGEDVWEDAVHRSGRGGDRGITTDLATAKHIAFAFMNDSVTGV
jgi:hypothetical protein